MEQTENGKRARSVAQPVDQTPGSPQIGKGRGEEERKKRVLEEEKGRRRGGGGEERYKEEEFRFSLQADGGKEKRRRELRQETRRYWAQLSCAVPS